jgi:cell wall-associated NlpC family hydrolase
MKRADIVARARREMGTPWQHQARCPGVAVDCHGFLGVVGKDCGVAEAEAWLADDELMRYGRVARPEKSLALARRYLDEIPPKEAIEGDILFLAHRKHPRLPSHFAIVTKAEPRTIIHAHEPNGEVVENNLPETAPWFPVHAFRFRGVE